MGFNFFFFLIKIPLSYIYILTEHFLRGHLYHLADIITPILEVNRMRMEAVTGGPTKGRAGTHATSSFQAKSSVRCDKG